MKVDIKTCIGCTVVALILGAGLGLKLALIIDGFLREAL